MAMSENEAIKFIGQAIIQSGEALEKLQSIKSEAERIGKIGEYYANLDNCVKEIEACRVAMNALSEIQQYRANGTVEGYERAIQSSVENYNLYRECKAKLQEYEAIGTIEDYWKLNEMCKEYSAIGAIEEFKALKEKNEPKKVKKSGVTDSNGVFHAINGINGVPYDLCPNCEINLCTDGIFGGNTKGMKYCKNCGQKLDWH